MNATTGIPSGWYSDGSLIKIGNKYYPYRVDNAQYYDYDNNKLMQYDYDGDSWFAFVISPSVFDQVPADFLSYLSTGNFTLVQG